MKKIVLVVLLLLPLATFAQGIFPDTVDHQYHGSIDFLYDRNIVQGFPDGTFGPDRPITRAEMLKIVFGATEEEMGSNRSNCFEDVQDQRYAPWVCYAKEQKIVQ